MLFRSCLEQSAAPQLSSLSIHIQCGKDWDFDLDVFSALRIFLNTAVSLRSLDIRIDPQDYEGGFDILADLQFVFLPRLRSLSLTSEYGVFTKRRTLETLFRKHAGTLKVLSLHRVNLGGVVEHGDTWCDVLQMLPEVVALEHFHIDTLTEGGYQDLSTYFQQENSCGRQAIYDYVLRGAVWPGWNEEIVI